MEMNEPCASHKYNIRPNQDVNTNNMNSPPALDENIHGSRSETHGYVFWYYWYSLCDQWCCGEAYGGCSCGGGHEGLSARKQVKKWWHRMDTPFQTDSHWISWLWFPPSDGWNEKDSYTYFKAQGSTKGLRNKEVWTFELNKGPSPIFHIRCAV